MSLKICCADVPDAINGDWASGVIVASSLGSRSTPEKTVMSPNTHQLELENPNLLHTNKNKKATSRKNGPKSKESSRDTKDSCHACLGESH